MSSYAERRRKWIHWSSWLGTVTLLFLLTFLVGTLASHLPTAWQESAVKAIGADSIFASVSVQTGSVVLALMAMLLVKLVKPAWGSRNAIGLFLYERLLDTLNFDLFEPVKMPSAGPDGVPPLEWLPPLESNGAADRLQVWQAMEDWALLDADLSVNSPQAFSWALLVGRPGAGKSRMAIEMARRLARHDVLEKSGPQSVRDRSDKLLLKIRSVFGRVRRRPNLLEHPWDIAVPGHRRNPKSAVLVQDATGFADGFQSWTPRAPTLILFEDPRAEEAATLIRWLSKRCSPVTERKTGISAIPFPVRLLVVSQTLPADLGLRPDPLANEGWVSSLDGFSGGPWVLSRRHYLTRQETAELRFRQFPPSDARRWGVNEEEAYELTQQGNPLLTESLLLWLQQQSADRPPALDKVSMQSLLKGRAERVRDGLAVAGVQGREALTLIGTATVCGGLPRPGAHDQLIPALSLASLQRAFPRDRKLEFRTPAIRPDLIGFAFVDLVVASPSEPGLITASEASQDAMAGRIARIGWTADPLAMLSCLERLSDRQAEGLSYIPDARNRLVNALTTAPSVMPEIDPDHLLRAFVRHHLRFGLDRPVLLQRFEAASPAAAHDVACRIVAEELTRPGDDSVPWAASAEGLAVFSMALRRSLADQPMAHVQLSQLMNALQHLAQVLEGRGDTKPPADTVPQEGLDLLGRTLASDVLMHPSHPWRNEQVALAFFDAIWRSRLTRHHALKAFANGILAGLAPHQNSIEHEVLVLQRLAEGVKQGLATDPGDVESYEKTLPVQWHETDHSLHEWVWLWSRAAYAHSELKQPEPAERCARSIELVAAPFSSLALSERRVLAEWQAQAWDWAQKARK